MLLKKKKKAKQIPLEWYIGMILVGFTSMSCGVFVVFFFWNGCEPEWLLIISILTPSDKSF